MTFINIIEKNLLHIIITSADNTLIPYYYIVLMVFIDWLINLVLIYSHCSRCSFGGPQFEL